MENVKYIPGDLVKDKYQSNEIFEVTNTSKYGYMLKSIENDVIINSTTETLIGIPLTPAILETNGWKCDGGQYVFKFRPCGGTKVELIGFFIEMFKDEHDMLKYKYFQITHENKVIYGCFYCHQLQHILFGLGLPSELKV